VTTKTKARTKAAILDEPTPAPMIGPETEEAWARRISTAMYKADVPKETREEFRLLLEKQPDLALVFGTLPSMARQQSLERFRSFPVMEESIRFQLKQMRADLAHDNASPLEVLLIDAVVLCYQDYFSFALLSNMHNKREMTLNGMEQWERVLASKETRYLRAIETLARVRRLLKLPGPQVNINLPGGQQVNVAGDVKP
jgi:hypothetical protein